MFYTAKITKLHEERCMIDEKNARKFSRLLILLYRAPQKSPISSGNRQLLLHRARPRIKLLYSLRSTTNIQRTDKLCS